MAYLHVEIAIRLADPFGGYYENQARITKFEVQTGCFRDLCGDFGCIARIRVRTCSKPAISDHRVR